MTNYNDGKWHGWNGGECPLHPNTLVQTQFAAESRIEAERGTARRAENFDWSGPEKLPTSHITNFRVIKEYREPRDWWVCINIYGAISQCSRDFPGSFLVREVID